MERRGVDECTGESAFMCVGDGGWGEGMMLGACRAMRRKSGGRR